MAQNRKIPRMWAKVLMLAVFAILCAAILAIDILP